jgi:hypothetical protein
MAEPVRKSAERRGHAAAQLEDSADRRTVLALIALSAKSRRSPEGYWAAQYPCGHLTGLEHLSGTGTSRSRPSSWRAGQIQRAASFIAPRLARSASPSRRQQGGDTRQRRHHRLRLRQPREGHGLPRRRRRQRRQKHRESARMARGRRRQGLSGLPAPPVRQQDLRGASAYT